MVDTCDWCKRVTDRIQIKPGQSIGLCPSCCPDVDKEELPDNAPSEWHFMSEEEREDWLNGMDLEEIREKYDWLSPPEPRT